MGKGIRQHVTAHAEALRDLDRCPQHIGANDRNLTFRVPEGGE
jgi:hypothetical protein